MPQRQNPITGYQSQARINDRCWAMVSAGWQCSRRRLPNSRYCRTHQDIKGAKRVDIYKRLFLYSGRVAALLTIVTTSLGLVSLIPKLYQISPIAVTPLATTTPASTAQDISQSTLTPQSTFSPTAIATHTSTLVPSPTATPTPTQVLPPTATPSPTLTIEIPEDVIDEQVTQSDPPSTSDAEPSKAASIPAPQPVEGSSDRPSELSAINNMVAATLNGRIAFTFIHTDTRELSVGIYDLSTEQLLTIYANSRQPTLNGNGILLVNGDDSGNGDNQGLASNTGSILDLALVNTQGLNSNPVAITSHPEDARPYWCDDGSMVFDSTRDGDGQSRIYWKPYASREGRARDIRDTSIDRALNGRYPVCFGDKLVAYNGCQGGNCGILLTKAEGQIPALLTNAPDDIPTGSINDNILFTSRKSNSWDVYTIHKNGGESVQLTFNPSHDGLATGSPDGQHIAFLTDRDGYWSIYVMNRDGSHQRKLLNLPGTLDHRWIEERLSWAPR